jgi:tetratricopeptide (TPR) repeat protein
MAKRSKKKKGPPEVSRGKVPEAKESLPGKSSVVPWATLVQVLVIAAAVLWIYWPALHGGWLWDDDQLVTENAIMHDPSGLWKIWFAPGSLVDYQPLKVSVVWLQWQLWGADTLGYHLTNVFLHIVGALLVWRLLGKFHLRLAWLGGLIFAIHPIQVESVAWIAELKNTLSLPPFLLAMCFWIDYEERGKSKDYHLALGLFLAAMLCKATMVMFPVVILLYAWWKRGRIGWHDAKASAPFFVVSLTLGLVTVWFLQHNSIGEDPVPMGGLFSRLACAGLSLSFYVSKCFLPVELIPIYPHWVVDPPTLTQFLPWPVLAAVIYWLWTKRESWGRYALLGLGFFLINLAPFLGFNAASYMAFTWVMDHLLYIPIIGLIGLVVAALGRMEIQLPASFRFYGIGLVIVVLALLAFQSRGDAKMYLNSETLWTRELKYNPEAYLGHNNLGKTLLEQGRLAEAMEQFEEVLRINPDYAVAHNNLGNVLRQTGRLPEAIEQYRQALRTSPDNTAMHFNLGSVLLQTGRVPEAIEQYRQALRISPDYAPIRYNLGNVLLQSGQLPEAIEQYRQALRINPDYAEAHKNLGLALFQTGQASEAIEQFEQALQLNPDDADACYNLATVLLQTGRVPEAIEQYERSLRIKPDNAEAHNNLGTALGQIGRVSEAIGQFAQALRLKPDDAEAHNNLGHALEQSGRLPEAREQFQQALRLKPDFTAARDNLARVQAALQKTAPAKN